MQTETMALKIGVMDGAKGDHQPGDLRKTHELGRVVAKSRGVLISGACPGLPLAAACCAKQKGGMVVGISPGLST
jgi:predicted Rossmann-fold nucleotide-binding protein